MMQSFSANDDSLWGEDEDDEFILLSSQLIDQVSNQNYQNVNVSIGHQINVGVRSTVNGTREANTDRKHLEHFFNDDDYDLSDLDFSLVDAQTREATAQTATNNIEKRRFLSLISTQPKCIFDLYCPQEMEKRHQFRHRRGQLLGLIPEYQSRRRPKKRNKSNWTT
jgi:hypothetical protein